MMNNNMMMMNNHHHPANKTTLFLGDLAIFCTEKDIETAFRPFGEIAEIKIMRSEETNRNLSYGFIKFVHAAAAKEAMDQLNGKVFCGRPIRINWAAYKNKLPSRETRIDGVHNSPVHVSFISYQLHHLVTEESLRQLFRRYGVVQDVSIKKSVIDSSGNKQSGYGFVYYYMSAEGVRAAIDAAQALQDTTIEEVNYKCSLSHTLLKYLNREIPLDLSVPMDSLSLEGRNGPVPSSSSSGSSSVSTTPPPVPLAPPTPMAPMLRPTQSFTSASNTVPDGGAGEYKPSPSTRGVGLFESNSSRGLGELGSLGGAGGRPSGLHSLSHPPPMTVPGSTLPRAPALNLLQQHQHHQVQLQEQQQEQLQHKQQQLMHQQQMQQLQQQQQLQLQQHQQHQHQQMQQLQQQQQNQQLGLSEGGYKMSSLGGPSSAALVDYAVPLSLPMAAFTPSPPTNYSNFLPSLPGIASGPMGYQSGLSGAPLSGPPPPPAGNVLGPFSTAAPPPGGLSVSLARDGTLFTTQAHMVPSPVQLYRAYSSPSQTMRSQLRPMMMPAGPPGGLMMGMPLMAQQSPSLSSVSSDSLKEEQLSYLHFLSSPMGNNSMPAAYMASPSLMPVPPIMMGASPIYASPYSPFPSLNPQESPFVYPFSENSRFKPGSGHQQGRPPFSKAPTSPSTSTSGHAHGSSNENMIALQPSSESDAAAAAASVKPKAHRSASRKIHQMLSTSENSSA